MNTGRRKADRKDTQWAGRSEEEAASEGAAASAVAFPAADVAAAFPGAAVALSEGEAFADAPLGAASRGAVASQAASEEAVS